MYTFVLPVFICCIVPVFAAPQPKPSLTLNLGRSVSVFEAAPNNLFNRQSFQCNNNDAIGTVYFSGTDPNQITACGEKYDPNSASAAVCTNYPHPGVSDLKDLCGTEIQINSLTNGETVFVTYNDLNANCGQPDDPYGPSQLDLSPAAYSSLGGVGESTITIDWNWQLTETCLPI
ncbi:hypothetical protein NA57DRAFT_53745 [Rhizodiscina lignyota]|uniref:Uncharacterized protein n=1 Tax=Rhizodiscina lignyota TaxID=1504668 RepID=A0A9P4MDM4_9PEZI|nr:hypothetical protein NA57DRAFT_53745 [Rhizodiscina lignyota]